jgi:hypothetical protein
MPARDQYIKVQSDLPLNFVSIHPTHFTVSPHVIYIDAWSVYQSLWPSFILTSFLDTRPASHKHSRTLHVNLGLEVLNTCDPFAFFISSFSLSYSCQSWQTLSAARRMLYKTFKSIVLSIGPCSKIVSLPDILLKYVPLDPLYTTGSNLYLRASDHLLALVLVF